MATRKNSSIESLRFFTIFQNNKLYAEASPLFCHAEASPFFYRWDDNNAWEKLTENDLDYDMCKNPESTVGFIISIKSQQIRPHVIEALLEEICYEKILQQEQEYAEAEEYAYEEWLCEEEKRSLEDE